MSFYFSSIDIVKYLIKLKGIKINIKNKEGRTILHKPYLVGHLNIVRFLIGLDIFNLKEKNNMKIINDATYSGNVKLVKYLIELNEIEFNCNELLENSKIHMTA